MSYNGWTNYETWNVALWLGNEEALYRDTIELARQAKDEWAAAEAIEEYVQDLRDETANTPGMFGDLLTNALNRVEWREIAKSMREDMEEADMEEEE